MDGQGGGSLLMLLVTSSLLLWQNVSSQSNFTNETAIQPTLKLSVLDLAERAGLLSYYLQSQAAQLYTEFVRLYPKDTELSFQKLRMCHTAVIPSPHDKETTLMLHDKDLLILSIRLLRSWEDPLSHLIAEALRLPNITPSFMEKAEIIQDKMSELLEGLMWIARRFDLQAREHGDPARWMELSSLQSTDRSVFMRTFHNLCHCLDRDVNKVDTFLKVMKNRIA